ncbi:hypothetical protein [Mesorhizobium sp. M1227]|uniref:hypothetical protein n=1 Tax=unclassified Mesorhizobium TaxID=325217 RepID=UPI003335AB01
MRIQITYSERTMNYARRLVIGLLLLVLGAGMPVLSAQAGQMPKPVTVTSVHQITLNGRNDCGCGDMAMMMTSACSSMGTCVQGMIATVGPTVRLPCNISPMYFAEHISGFSVSPEPFPPKPYILA